MLNIYLTVSNDYHILIAEFDGHEGFTLNFPFNTEGEDDAEGALSLAREVAEIAKAARGVYASNNEEEVIISYESAGNNRQKFMHEFFSDTNIAADIVNFLNQLIDTIESAEVN